MIRGEWIQNAPKGLISGETLPYSDWNESDITWFHFLGWNIIFNSFVLIWTHSNEKGSQNLNSKVSITCYVKKII